jgi:Ras family protein
VGVHGYALVFSLVSRQSFERISQINEALLHALGDAQDIPRVLVGTMRDMTDQRHVSRQVG